MKIKFSQTILIFTFLFLIFYAQQTLLAGEPQAKTLLKTTASWNGGSFSYPQGKAEVTIVKIRLDEGESAPLHCHTVPNAAYILDGTLQVKLQTGESKVFKKGQSMMEVSRTLHKGKAMGGAVEILVFYAGATGVSLTEFEDSKNCIVGANQE